MKCLKFPLLLVLMLGLAGCSVSAIEEEAVVAETPLPVTPTAIPTATAVSTMTPRPTPSFVTFAETAKVSEDLLYVEGLLAEISTEEKVLILTGGINEGALESAQVLLASNQVPFADSGVKRSPCPVDDPNASPNYVTQYFYWEPGMYWQTTPGYHPGVDIVCGGRGTNTEVMSPVDNLVIARYWIPLSDQNSITYWSSGTTYIGKTNMPIGRINPDITARLSIQGQYVPMLFAIGHMQADGTWPQPGEVVSLSTQIGNQGSTGNSSGPHVHYAWFIEMADGTLYAVDPLTAFVY